MQLIYLNERLWAEDILDTGNLTNDKGRAISVLVKYFYQYEGLRGKALVGKTINFLQQVMDEYSQYDWDAVVERAAKSAKKPLVEIDAIVITKNEMNTITSMRTKRLQRLLFTMLCVAKFFNIIHANNNSWVNLEWADLFRYASISVPLKDQIKMYRELIDAGVIQYSKKVGNNNAKVLFVEDNGEPELEVKDFRSIGHEYQAYCGEPYERCQKCGALFRQGKRRPRKYCTECANGSVMKIRTFDCLLCGREVYVVARNSNSCYCPECALKARALRNKRYYDKKKAQQNKTEDQF